jgi:hypothetical protein
MQRFTFVWGKFGTLVLLPYPFQQPIIWALRRATGVSAFCETTSAFSQKCTRNKASKHKPISGTYFCTNDRSAVRNILNEERAMYKTIYRLATVILVLAFTLGNYASAGAISAIGENIKNSISAQQTNTSTRMLIPLYSDPPAQWTSVINANTYKNIDVILNPSDGPGASIQSSYTNGIAQLRNAGVGVFGYVYTGYGTRPLATVKAEVDSWKNWYSVDGIFFDEASNSSTNLSYYSNLQTYVTDRAMTSILNPGTGTMEAYMSVADTNMIYENDPSSPLSISTWAVNYPASKFGALQYAASAAQMRTFVASAKAQNIGYVFVTDDVLNNPWDKLPAYLAEEAALLAGNTTPPTPTATSTIQATNTIAPTLKPTNTTLPSATSTLTATTQPSFTPSSTPTLVATSTLTSTATWTATLPPTATNLPTFTSTPTSTKVLTASPTNTVTIPSPIISTILPAGRNVVEVRVTRGRDDVEESSTGKMYLNSNDLELVYDGNNQVVGIRFSKVNIPKGATITNAYIQFSVDEASSQATALSIQGEANPNSASFTTKTHNISSRLRTFKSATWSPVAWLQLKAKGLDQRTPNLAPIVQEIVNQQGWVAGNSLVMIITGTGKRVAEAYEVDHAGAPLLHIEYSLPVTSANTPAVTATPLPIGSPIASSTSPVISVSPTTIASTGTPIAAPTIIPPTPTTSFTDTPYPTEVVPTQTELPTETPITPTP